ncbi:MAG: signal peptidase I [Chloroflexi bacterium]|nr:signal peptidase I [Chloroflexota bacterium]
MTELLVLRTWRVILGALIVVLSATVLMLGIGARVGPTIGYELFAIRSGSMEPSIGVGALTVVDRSRAPRVGEVVTVRLPSDTFITHRVTRVVEVDGDRWIETRGDANTDPDPALIPSDAVVGVVATRIAFLGYLLALLSMPSGIVTLLAAGATLLVANRLVEGAEGRARERRERRHRRATAISGRRLAPLSGQ